MIFIFSKMWSSAIYVFTAINYWMNQFQLISLMCDQKKINFTFNAYWNELLKLFTYCVLNIVHRIVWNKRFFQSIMWIISCSAALKQKENSLSPTAQW
jgi:hypothetical protein